MRWEKRLIDSFFAFTSSIMVTCTSTATRRGDGEEWIGHGSMPLLAVCIVTTALCCPWPPTTLRWLSYTLRLLGERAGGNRGGRNKGLSLSVHFYMPQTAGANVYIYTDWRWGLGRRDRELGRTHERARSELSPDTSVASGIAATGQPLMRHSHTRHVRMTCALSGRWCSVFG